MLDHRVWIHSFFVPLCGESLAVREREREVGETVTIWVIYEDVLHKALTHTHKIPNSRK
jgi:hypothetical protein